MYKTTALRSLTIIFMFIGQVVFEQGTTWKQISNHIFFPKDTSLESEKIEGIWGGSGCGVRMPQSVAPSREVKKYPLKGS